MKKVREFITDFRHIGEDTTGYQSDDTSYSDQAIWSQMIKSRATVVKDRDKPNFFSDNMFQTLTCVMFEEVDANECGLIPQSGCTIMKSTCALPNMLKLVSVTSQLGNETFDIIRWDQVQGKLNSRVESARKQIYATIRNINGKQYLYLINNLHIQNAVVVAIAEDPIEFAQFCGNKEALCNPLELDIHTDARIQDLVLKLTLDTILGVRRTTRPDIINDDGILT
jgi:hypothetical protein